MKTNREINIQSYIKEHREECLLEDAGIRQIVYHGKVNEHEVYRLPIELLSFNVENGRLAYEVLQKERELKRRLDPFNKADADVIQELLLSLSQDETDALESDLIDRGQLEPGLITFDGILINANRRMAILRRLYSKSHNEKYGYLNVAILPTGVDHKDLWKIEANLQFAKEFKLDYAGINELLKLRTGRDSGLSLQQIRDALQKRYSEKKLQQRFDVLELVEQYLEWLGKPRQYQVIEEERSLERFNSLQLNVIAPLKGIWGTKAKVNIPRLVVFAFKMIKDGQSHWDIRHLRDIAENPEALAEIIKLKKATTVVAKTKRAGVSKTESKREEKKDIEAVRDTFEDAKNIVAAHQERDLPEKLLRNALTNLRQIDTDSISLKQESIKVLVDEIREILATIKKK